MAGCRVSSPVLEGVGDMESLRPAPVVDRAATCSFWGKTLNQGRL
jgi:hypothetical protein